MGVRIIPLCLAALKTLRHWWCHQNDASCPDLALAPKVWAACLQRRSCHGLCVATHCIFLLQCLLGDEQIFFFLRVVGGLASCSYHWASQVDQNVLEQWEGNILVNCPWGPWRKWRKALCTWTIPLLWTQGHLSKTCGKPSKIKAVPSAHLRVAGWDHRVCNQTPGVLKRHFLFSETTLQAGAEMTVPRVRKELRKQS